MWLQGAAFGPRGGQVKIMAALLPQARVVEAGVGGSPRSQVEVFLTGDGSGIVWGDRGRNH